MRGFSWPTLDALDHLNTPARRYHANMAALELLHRIRQEERKLLSEDEQRILASYTGFGEGENIKRLFDSDGLTAREKLAAITDVHEQQCLRTAALTAFYTPLTVCAAIWDGVLKLGLAELDRPCILEPSMGIGNFIATMPSSLREKSQIVGVELDSLSSQMAMRLHPDVKVLNVGFEKTALPASFDLIISNVPFGDFPVDDQSFPTWATRRIHDYFLIRSMTLLRPGGLLVVLTSYGTLDKDATTIREALAQQAELVAAYRFPNGDNGIFAATNGTAAGADLIIFQKRTDPRRQDAALPPWVTTTLQQVMIQYGGHFSTGNGVTIFDGDKIRINAHFAHYPLHIFGTASVVRRGTEGFLSISSHQEPLAEQLQRALGMVVLPFPLPTHSTSHISADEPLAIVIPPPPNARQIVQPTIPEKLHEAQHPRAKALISLYMLAKELLAADIDNARGAAALRQQLNDVYDDTVWRYGSLHNQKNKVIIAAIPELVFLLALEINVRGKQPNLITDKAPIFTQATVRPMPRQGQITPQEALITSLDMRGHVDMSLMCSLTEMEEDVICTALTGRIFLLPPPEQGYVTTEEYLSGNLGEKINAARAAQTMDTRFSANVEALTAALPPPLTKDQIVVRLGAPWVPTEVIQQFLEHLLPTYTGEVRCYLSGQWEIDPHAETQMSVAATTTWGTPRMGALDILSATLNNRPVSIYDTLPDDQRVVNKDATLAAQDKQHKMRETFGFWIWQESARAQQLVQRYNKQFNCYRVRTYDGSHLTLPGMTTVGLRRDDLDPHQKAAIWQALTNQACLIGHEVGLGKTYSAIATAVELKRLGLARKPMVVTTNPTVTQWAEAARHLYPGLRVLAMTPQDFEGTNRSVYLSKIATGDDDLVIISHTSFERIPVSPSTMEAFLTHRLDDLREFLFEVKAANGKRRTIKHIEKRIQHCTVSLQQTLRALRHDNPGVITWDELGVDALIVDEAHYYKNDEIDTAMTVAGIPRGGSQRALDMRIKTRTLLKKQGRVIFMTATPVMNSLVEVYVMMRFLQEDLLKRHGLTSFDAWARTFAEEQTTLELAPAGDGYRMYTRLSAFINVPELANLWRQCLSVCSADDAGIPRPALLGEKPITVSVPPSAALQRHIKTLSQRAEVISRRAIAPTLDNMLMITNEGRLAALDMRLIDVHAPDEPTSKVNQLVQVVATIYQRTMRERGTQVVFCDLDTPTTKNEAVASEQTQGEPDDEAEHNSDGKAPQKLADTAADTTLEESRVQARRGFIYHEIKAKLVRLGLQPDEIAFAHDHRTKTRREQLFAAMRSGRVRVLIGSSKLLAEGVNIQERLIAVHHLDAPWRPGDITQREGRARRQGNAWQKVAVFQYVTQKSFDVYLWGRLESKADFITQIMAGTITARSISDVSDVVLNFAEVKAIAIGDPTILEQTRLENEMRRLERLQGTFAQQQTSVAFEIRTIPAKLAAATAQRDEIQHAYTQWQQTRSAWQMTLMSEKTKGEERLFTRSALADNALRKLIRRIHLRAVQEEKNLRVTVGTYGGCILRVIAESSPKEIPYLLVRTAGAESMLLSRVAVTGTCSVIDAIDATFQSVPKDIEKLEREIADLQTRHNDLTAIVDQPWEHAAAYEKLKQKIAQLMGTRANTPATDEAKENVADEIEEEAGTVSFSIAWESLPWPTFTGAVQSASEPQKPSQDTATTPQRAALAEMNIVGRKASVTFGTKLVVSAAKLPRPMTRASTAPGQLALFGDDS